MHTALARAARDQQGRSVSSCALGDEDRVEHGSQDSNAAMSTSAERRPSATPRRSAATAATHQHAVPPRARQRIGGGGSEPCL